MSTHTIASSVAIDRSAAEVAAHVLDWGHDATTVLTGRGVMNLVAPLLAPSYRRADAVDLRTLADHLVGYPAS